MRIVNTFERQIAGASSAPLLGSDALDPNTEVSGSPVAPYVGKTNLYNSGVLAAAGAPVMKIAVTLKCAPGSPAIPVRLWYWDSTTAHWYTIEAAKTIAPSSIVFFQVPVLSEPRAMDNNPATSGSIQALVIPADPGGTAGVYTFGVAATLA